MYVKCYPIFDVASVLYQVHRSRPHRWVQSWLPVLEQALGYGGGLTRAPHRSDRIIFHPFLSSQCSLDQAKRLLESTELNISQVAARVGFSTSQHFSRVFRKHTGLSPARYRLPERAQISQTEKS